MKPVSNQLEYVAACTDCSRVTLKAVYVNLFSSLHVDRTNLKVPSNLVQLKPVCTCKQGFRESPASIKGRATSRYTPRQQGLAACRARMSMQMSKKDEESGRIYCKVRQSGM